METPAEPAAEPLLARARLNRLTLEDLEARLHDHQAQATAERELEVDLNLAIEELVALEREFDQLPADHPDLELIGVTLERSRQLVDQCQLRLGEQAAERPALDDVVAAPVEAYTTAAGLGPEEPEPGYESPSLTDPPHHY